MDRHRQVLDGQCRILRFVELGQHLFERLAVALTRASAIGSSVIIWTAPTPAEASSVITNSTITILNSVLFILRSSYFNPKRRGLTYLLIRGTTEFMIRIANDIPSG